MSRQELSPILETLEDLVGRFYDIESITTDFGSDSDNSQFYAKLTALQKHYADLNKAAQMLKDVSKSKRITSGEAAVGGEVEDQGLMVPQEVIEYIEAGRNPRIYTRQFSELVQKLNQEGRGKLAAYQSFSEILAAEIGAEFSDLRGDIDRLGLNASSQPEPMKHPNTVEEGRDTEMND